MKYWQILKEFTNTDLNEEFTNIKNFWNDHNLGYRAWDNLLAQKITFNSATGAGTIVMSSGAQIEAADGTQAAPGYAFANDGSLGFYRIGATDLGLSMSNLKIMEWTGTTITTFGKTAIQGTPTNDNAASGYVGESFYAASTTPANFAATGVRADLASIAVTAGDWDLSFCMTATPNGSTCTFVEAFIGTAAGNNTTGLLLGDNYAGTIGPTATIPASSVCVANYRVSLTGAATYYLKVLATYSAGTPQVTGRISARRIR